MNLAYAFVVPELAAKGSRMELDPFGDLFEVEVIAVSPYRPEFGRMRGGPGGNEAVIQFLRIGT